MPETAIARSIRMAMAKKKMSSVTLSILFGVNRQTVTNWRNDGCNNIKTLEKIAGYLDMTYDELLELGNE